MALSQIGSNQSVSVRACNSAVPQPCLGELADPEGHDVTIEGWVKKRAAEPRLSQAVVALRVVDGSAIPRARVGSGRIEIERAEHLDDPARRDVNLRLADAGLMRSQRHGAARRRHSGMSSPSSMAFAGGSTATSPTCALNFSRAPCDAQSHARSRLPSSLSSPSPSALRTCLHFLDLACWQRRCSRVSICVTRMGVAVLACGVRRLRSHFSPARMPRRGWHRGQRADAAAPSEQLNAIGGHDLRVGRGTVPLDTGCGASSLSLPGAVDLLAALVRLCRLLRPCRRRQVSSRTRHLLSRRTRSRRSSGSPSPSPQSGGRTSSDRPRSAWRSVRASARQ